MAFWVFSLCRLLLLVGLLGSSAAIAQLSRDLIVEGQTTVLATGAKPFTSIFSTLGEATSQPAQQPGLFELVYAAPLDGRGKIATVRYTPEGGAPVTVFLDIVAPDSPYGDAYQPVFNVLFTLFVVAVLLEAALALVFNWRLFLITFDSRGAKTLFSFAGGLWLVNAFDLDVMARIVQLLWSPQVEPDWMTKLLSAMILAGGSSSVNSLLIALNFRSVRNTATLEPKPPPTKGWLAVQLRRTRVLKGPVTLEIKDEKGSHVRLHQFIGQDVRPPLLHALLRDPLRFPPGGGIAVEPDKPLHIRLTGLDEEGKKVVVELGPISLANGAMVDIDAAV